MEKTSKVRMQRGSNVLKYSWPEGLVVECISNSSQNLLQTLMCISNALFYAEASIKRLDDSIYMTLRKKKLPWWLGGKNLGRSVRDERDTKIWSLLLGSSPEEGITTHSSIPAWRTYRQRSLYGTRLMRFSMHIGTEEAKLLVWRMDPHCQGLRLGAAGLGGLTAKGTDSMREFEGDVF